MSISSLGLIAASGNNVKDWELKYAHFDGIAPATTNQEATPSDIQFNSTGTRVYFIGASSDTIHERALSVPYDTGTMGPVKLVLGSQVTSPAKIDLSQNGTTLIISNNTSTLYYYTLSVPYDITTATYTGSRSFSTNVTTIVRAKFADNDNRLYILDNANTIYQFTLSSVANITTASFVAYQNFTPSGLPGFTSWNSFTILANSANLISNGWVARYTRSLGTAWDIQQYSFISNGAYAASLNDGVVIANGDLTGPLSSLTTTLQSYQSGTASSSASISARNIPGSILSITVAQSGLLLHLLMGSGSEIYITPLKVRSSSNTISDVEQGIWVGSVQTNPLSMYIKPDNSVIYFSGSTTATIRSIEFTTPNSFYTGYITSNSLSSPGTLPYGLFFSSDGTRMYITDDTTNICYGYSLSTPWSFSSATRTNKDYNFTTVLGLSPRKCIFSSDGSKVFLSTNTNSSIYQYSLTTPWDLTTLNTSSAVVFDPPKHTATTTTGTGLTFNNTGKTLYKIDTSSDYIYAYFFQNAWDLSSPQENYKFSTILEETNSSGIAFNSSGTRMYVLGNTGDDINNYTLSTPWKVETAVYNGVYVVSTQTGTTPITIVPNSTATKMFVLSGTNRAIYLYTTSSAGSFVTGLVSYYSSLSVSTEDTNPQGIAISHDDTRLYMLGATNRSVYEYTLGSGGILVGASYSGNSVNLSSFITTPRDLFLGKNGTRLYITDISTKRLYQFNMSTAYSLSTATYVGYYDLPAIVNTTAGLFFKPDGKAFFTVDSTSDHVFKYLIG